MGRKKKATTRWLVWSAVAFALACLWLLPVPSGAPRTHWRAPVLFSMPSFPSLPRMDQAVDLVHRLEGQALSFEEGLKESWTQTTKEPEPLDNRPQEPHTPSKTHGRIALIIDDMGLSPATNGRFVALPPFVTLSYLPYAPRVQEQVDRARARGHEVMLHLPMQPIGGADPGPAALFVGQDAAVREALIARNLAAFTGYVGVNNHMGSRFTGDEEGMASLAEALRARGAFFIDSYTSPRSIAVRVMREAAVPVIARDVFLDDTPSPEAIRHELARVERLASRNGQAVAIGHPHMATIEALEAWIADAQRRGFLFVRARDIVAGP